MKTFQIVLYVFQALSYLWLLIDQDYYYVLSLQFSHPQESIMNKALRPERLELHQRNKKQSTITIQSYVIAGDVQTF